MAKDRKGAEAFILKYVNEMDPSGLNVSIYESFFKTMSNQRFDEWMSELKNGQAFLVIHMPPNSKVDLNTKRNIAIGKKLGHEFFQRVWVGARGNVPAHLTPVKFLIARYPIRRASQLLTKKISVPDHNKSVDLLTGQVTGDSKGSRISYPELRVLASLGLDNTLEELIKFRGGDAKGLRALNTLISRHGSADLKTLRNYSSGVESTRLLKTYLTGMMLRNNV